RRRATARLITYLVALISCAARASPEVACTDRGHSNRKSLWDLSIDINKLVRTQQRLAQVGVDPFRSCGRVHVHIPLGLLLKESQQPVQFGTRRRTRQSESESVPNAVFIGCRRLPHHSFGEVPGLS